MPVPNGCSPCDCIGANINDAYFKQAVLTILCDISEGGGISESVNITGINGVAPSVGSGASDTGTLRVNLATGTSGSLIAEDSAATNLELLTKIGFVQQSVLSASMADGDWGWGKLDSIGRFWISGTSLEDAASVSGDEGHVNLFRRTDTVATQTTTDGDYEVPQMFDGRVTITNRDRIVTGTLDMTSTASVLAINVDGMESVSVQFTRTTETGNVSIQGSLDGTNYVTLLPLGIQNAPTAYEFPSSTGSESVANSYILVAGVAGLRNVRVKVVNAGSGAALPVTIVASAGMHPVIQGVYPGGGANALGKVEDNAHSSGDVGVFSLNLREATPTTSFTAGTDGDYQGIKSNTLGVLYVEQANQVATYAASTTAGAAGGVTTTGASVLTNSAKAKVITVLSTLDVAVQISPDAGTTYPYTLAAGSTTPQRLEVYLGDVGRWTASNIFAKTLGSNSASGSLYLGLTI